MKEISPHPPPSILVYGHVESASFAPDRNPHLPVVVAFGSGPMHRISACGHWDMERAAAENKDHLLRSVRTAGSQGQPCWDDLTFQFDATSFLHVDPRCLTGFSSTSAGAEGLVENFAENYALPPEPEAGCYSLIRLGRDLERMSVQLDEGATLSDEQLLLHYGDDALIRHADLVRELCTRKHGMALFEGPPGTGKKSYLRHLVGSMRGTHRFYFIPAPAHRVLSDPSMVGFWIDQRYRYKDKQFALILEDCDALFSSQGASLQGPAQALVYLIDGLLANFLRLQILCTVNGSIGSIDPALLRPGRLICQRAFERLDVEQSHRLAAHLGRILPEAHDYSLAEIFG